jgi:hypothetical protein
MVAELRALDARRVALVNQLKGATERLFSGENPFPWGPGRKAGSSKREGRPAGKHKRRPMSAAARKKISEAQKARWAKQRARK